MRKRNRNESSWADGLLTFIFLCCFFGTLLLLFIYAIQNTI